jgi:hypothetical protein
VLIQKSVFSQCHGAALKRQKNVKIWGGGNTWTPWPSGSLYKVLQVICLAAIIAVSFNLPGSNVLNESNRKEFISLITLFHL